MLSREIKHRSSAAGDAGSETDFSIAVLWTSIAICVSLMGLGFWGHFGLGDTLIGQICLHIAIAAIVAFILILTLEFNARRFSRREAKQLRDLISRDVFQALFGRIVPPEVFYEIDDILRRDTVRRNCQYRITLLAKEGMPPGYFVIRREVMFEVENLLKREVEFEAQSSHSDDEDLGSAAWPHANFHIGLLVDNRPIKLTAKNLVVEGTVTRMTHRVKLGPGEVKQISYQGEEPGRLASGRSTYLQRTPVIGILVEIRNEVPEISEVEVQMNHPAFKAEQDNFGRYYLDRAFLPGQGFQVIWKQRTEGGRVLAQELQPEEATEKGGVAA